MDNKQCTGPEWTASGPELAVAMAMSTLECDVAHPSGPGLVLPGPCLGVWDTLTIGLGPLQGVLHLALIGLL